MTEQETGKILAMISEIYPIFRKDRNPETILKVWHAVLKDSHYIDMQDALIQYVAEDTGGFPPPPGALLKIAGEIEQWDEVPGFLTVCRLVSRAVRHGPGSAEEEFRALPREAREIIGSPENLRAWAAMDSAKQEKTMHRFSDKAAALFSFPLLLPAASQSQEDSAADPPPETGTSPARNHK